MIGVMDYIIEKLEKEKIRHIFMAEERNVKSFCDAIEKNENVETVYTFLEQTAAYAAIAYSQIKESMGACFVSTGYAGTNTVSGVLCAWQNSIPCIFVSGQNNLKETTHYSNLPIRTLGCQEADIVSLVKPVTKYAAMITDPDTVAFEIEKAIYLANEGRKGPVWIDVPLDIQNMQIEPDEQEHFDIPDDNYNAEEENISIIVNEIENAENPAVLIGTGIRQSGAKQDFVDFIRKNNIPVVSDSAAADIFSGEELDFGVIDENVANHAGKNLMQNADLLIVMGCRMNYLTTGKAFEKFAENAKIIVIDIDEAEHLKNTVNIDTLIIADIKDVLMKLNKRKISAGFTEWKEKWQQWKTYPLVYGKTETLNIECFVENLFKAMEDEAVVLCDSGFKDIIIESAAGFKDKQRFIHTPYQQIKGFAQAGSIGAYYATKKQVISVTGNVSVMMNIQELQTISKNNLPVKMIVLNDEVGKTDRILEKMAAVFNIKYIMISNSKKIEQELSEMLKTDGTVICEVIGDGENDKL